MTGWDKAPSDSADATRKLLRTSFSPTAPVNRQEVFAGRRSELKSLSDAIDQRGQHAVIYGDRGVGKTSLALVAQESARAAGMFTSLITCDSTATFAKIWRQAFREISVTHPDESDGDATYLLDDSAMDPDDIRLAFKTLSYGAPVVVFIDEFDTIADPGDRKAFANLIKILSDHAIEVTVVFVGVARDVNQLIFDHASVQRVLAEVRMPRMTPAERVDIVTRGLGAAGMKATRDASERISMLSQGMPTIVHRLAQQAGIEAVDRESLTVAISDVRVAIEPVISRNMETISTVYESATFAGRTDTLYEPVALACACAVSDEKGYFASGALRVPLQIITGTQYEIPAFSAHLKAFRTNRGPLLERSGERAAFRYRFLDPLYPPYIILRALQRNVITDEQLVELSPPTFT